MPWRGPKTALQGCKHKPHLRQGSLQDGLGPRTRRRQQKSQFMQGRQQKFHFMQGPFDDGKGLSPGNKRRPQGRGQKSHVRASKKSNFRQGSFAEGKGLTSKKATPGRGASKKSHFRQGSFAGGKGLTGNTPIPARGASKKSHFR